MNRAELAEKIAEKIGITKKQAEDVLRSFESHTIKALQQGQEVTLAGFGTFSARVRKERGGVNPRNPKERIQIPTVTVPKFKAGKNLKDELKSGKAGSAGKSEDQDVLPVEEA
ncbi:MAG: HU family DNA-binding protein [Patescibacteria group bacterium]|jgi:DNA-binding protein HU-beta